MRDVGYEPLQVAFTCYSVLRTLGDARADMILQDTYALLLQSADAQIDPEQRTAFLVAVPVHRAIVRAWQETGRDPGSVIRTASLSTGARRTPHASHLHGIISKRHCS
ncbi:hypothetical protein HC891_13225 [Candidatus Gracilibacteria bacterium]|nr:hypothetical protein [Candidatus Gracilibacteria bacterium]